jgi:succinate dehydrogenase / fumarate reductase flavoprotein subunit
MENRTFNPGWHTAMELKHMMTVAEAIARAAKEKEGKPGWTFSRDFPDKSEKFGNVNIAIRKESDDKMNVTHVPKATIREDLQQIINEMK